MNIGIVGTRRRNDTEAFQKIKKVLQSILQEDTIKKFLKKSRGDLYEV